VAGAFTVDSLGGAFIERVEGDPSTVVGMSLSTIRRLVRELGVEWTGLWSASS
ncbi:MAG: Maf family protein, partial [Microbacterium gubbeenense]